MININAYSTETTFPFFLQTSLVLCFIIAPLNVGAHKYVTIRLKHAIYIVHRNAFFVLNKRLQFVLAMKIPSLIFRFQRRYSHSRNELQPNCNQHKTRHSYEQCISCALVLLWRTYTHLRLVVRLETKNEWCLKKERKSCFGTVRVYVNHFSYLWCLALFYLDNDRTNGYCDFSVYVTF